MENFICRYKKIQVHFFTRNFVSKRFLQYGYKRIYLARWSIAHREHQSFDLIVMWVMSIEYSILSVFSRGMCLNVIIYLNVDLTIAFISRTD